MHELSIALSILNVAAEEAARRNARPVAIHVRIGDLSGVIPEALTSAFEIARESTELSHCRLVVESVPVIIYCDHCGSEYPAESIQSLRCQQCGTPAELVMAGRELELAALEVDE